MEPDTAERPSWLTKEFLQETLRTRDIFKDVTVTDSSAHPAVGRGENYTSFLFRIGVKYRRENDKTDETRLIIKVLPSVVFMANWLTELDTFNKEMTIIGDIIPSMLRILEEKAPDRKFQPLSAYCYKTEIPHTLILEDLTTVGCKLADRRQQLDLAHSVVVLKGLARFHAASVALNIKYPSIFDMFKQETMYVEKNKEKMKKFMDTTKSALAGIIGRWEGLEKYPDKINAVFPILFDRIVALVKQKPNSFSVLNHGDCWVNNMLFHYCPNTGEVDGVRFIDFQLARYNSPALDLQYFMFSSPQAKVRCEKMDYLLEVYHKELCDTLRILDQDPEQYSLQQLKDDFEEKHSFGFLTVCTVLTAVLTEPSDAFEMSKLNEDGTGVEVEDLEKPYSGERFKAALQILLPYFEKKGVL